MKFSIFKPCASFFCLVAIAFLPFRTEGAAVRGKPRPDIESRVLKGSKGKGKGKGGSKGGSKGSSSSRDYGPPLYTESYASGQQNVNPNVITAGKAKLYLKFQKDFSYASYKVEIADLNSVTGVYLVCEYAGEEGERFIQLYSGTASNPSSSWETLVEGVITAPDLDDNFLCQAKDGVSASYLSNPAALFTAILRDEVAFEVTTALYEWPYSEVRGQIFTYYDNLGTN